ncbi:MAG: 6-phosphogluconolactonase [Yonghaparkia sp.]|nr:6-phosphogluconolactonase [Microcella sp.]
MITQHILPTAEEMGAAAADRAAQTIREAIAERGSARIVLSTGASQFTTLDALIAADVDWSKVEMFHLDEYIGLDAGHSASFVRYLTERFVSKVPLGAVHFVDPSIGVDRAIDELTERIRRAPIDLGLIGIGENAHLAFNDPPADFETTDAYIVVELDRACREQQVREGWFPTIDDVPTHAISMTVHQILECRHIISPVPYAAKADAIEALFATASPTPNVPASALHAHSNVDLFLDEASASKTLTSTS